MSTQVLDVLLAILSFAQWRSKDLRVRLPGYILPGEFGSRMHEPEFDGHSYFGDAAMVDISFVQRWL